MPRPIIILDPRRFAQALAEAVHEELHPTLLRLLKGQRSLMSISQDISAQADEISAKADENAAAVNEAIALIEQLEASADPGQQAALTAALDKLRSTSTELNDSTTRLATAAAPQAGGTPEPAPEPQP